MGKAMPYHFNLTLQDYQSNPSLRNPRYRHLQTRIASSDVSNAFQTTISSLVALVILLCEEFSIFLVYSTFQL